MEHRILKIIDDVGIYCHDGNDVTLDSNFRDLDCDSLDIVEMVMETEREFNVSIPDSWFDEMTTVGAYIDRVKALITTKPDKGRI